MAEEEVVEEYESSLAELTFNSKPQINMLTMLAEDHEQHASHIVKVIEDRIEKMESKKKLPLLYLIDSVIKNLQTTNYPRLFSQNIVTTFSGVFEKICIKKTNEMFIVLKSDVNVALFGDWYENKEVSKYGLQITHMDSYLMVQINEENFYLP